LVITHDLESIAGITTHVVVLRRGKLVFEERRKTGYSFDELKDTDHTHSE
jgi:ABC-type dipeptide/oligopeptide/nickel transport system ATPase component